MTGFVPRGDAAATALGIGYRPAVDADLTFLSDVYAHTRFDELRVTGWSEAAKRAFLQQQFDAQHAHYRAHYASAQWLVIEREGTGVGRLYLDEWAEEIRIVDIALLPAARGHGIGGAILTDLARHADAQGKPLSIHVERNNPARSLYDRFGFAVRGDAGVYELMMRPVGK